MHDQSAQTTPEVEAFYARSLLDIGIPPRPAILDLLAREMKREEPDFGAIARHVAEDVSLSAGLIKTVNSPFFGLRTRARTVPQALALLGIRTAAKAIAGVALRNAFPASPNLERFWDSSARIAEYSGHLVEILGVAKGIRGEDAHTFGLFRDCGMPVLMRKFPDYRQTLARANADPQRRFTVVEDEAYPTNHAIVGCMLAQSWSLPEEICLAIRHHHDFLLMQTGAASLPPASRRLIALAQAAEYVHQSSSGLNQTQEWLKLGPACLHALDVAEQDLENLGLQVIALHNGSAER